MTLMVVNKTGTELTSPLSTYAANSITLLVLPRLRS